MITSLLDMTIPFEIINPSIGAFLVKRDVI